MSVAIEETRGILEKIALEDYDETGPENAALIQAVDALDLLEEALAESTRLSDELELAKRDGREAEGRSVEVEQVWNKAVRRINNIIHEVDNLKAEVG
jgi:hypothetical protein